MKEYLSRSVDYEPERVVIRAIEQRAPARLLIAGFAFLFVFRTVGRLDPLSSMLIIASVTALAALSWALAPRREIVFDSNARRIEVRTRTFIRRPVELVLDFDAIKHCAIRAIGDVWLWNVDTREHSLTLCSFRDEFDAKRLQSMLSGAWPKR